MPDLPEVIGAPARRRLHVSARSVVLAVAVITLSMLVLRILSSAARVLVWMLIAASTAALVYPAIDRMSRRIPRGLAVAAFALGGLLVVAGVTYGLVEGVVEQTDVLERRAPQLARQIETDSRFGQAAREADLSERIERLVRGVPERLRGGTPAEAIRSATTRGLSFLAVFVLTVFFLLHGPNLASAAARQIHDERRRVYASRVASAVYRRAFGYARGTVAMAALAGIFAYGTARAADVPGPAPLALWVALWDAVPLLGAAVGALPIIVLAGVLDPVRGIVVLAGFVAYQVFEVMVLQRRLERSTAKIGPFLTTAAGFAGLELYGLAGALLSVLAVAVVAVALDESTSPGRGIATGMEMSDKHGARLDDDLQKDTRGGEDAREQLRADDHRPDVVQRNEGVLDDADAARRSELARMLEPSIFPARPSQLEESAAGNFASEGILRALQALPDRVYENVQDVWSTLGGPVEEKRA